MRSSHSRANRGMQFWSQGTLGPCQSANTNLLMRNPNLIVNYLMVFCWPFKVCRKYSKAPYWLGALPLSSITCCPAQGCNMCMASGTAKYLRNDTRKKFWKSHFSLFQNRGFERAMAWTKSNFNSALQMWHFKVSSTWVPRFWSLVS